MRRPSIVLGAFGAVLGGLGAVGWHWVPAFGERLGSPVRLRPDQSPYSGVVTEDQVIHWVPVSWPVLVVLPLLGVALGVALGVVIGRARVSPRSGWNVTEAVAVAGLGLVLGAASAVAWHYDPTFGAWAGLLEEKVDVGYPAAGLVLAAVFLAVVRPGRTG